MTRKPQNALRADEARRFGWLATAAAIATFGLIVLGGVVRITGSGMGCGPDWPLCNGQLIPLMDLPTFIEWFHRLVAAGVATLVFALVAYAWWPGRGGDVGRGTDAADRLDFGRLRRLSAAAAGLVVVQVLLGAVTVWLELPPVTVILHLVTAMVLLALLIAAAVRALAPDRRERLRDAAARVGWWSAGFGLLVVLAGGLVANLQAAAVCQGFPLCNGAWLPAENWRIQLHWGHRMLAYGLVAWALFLPFWVARRRPDDRGARRAAVAVAFLAAAQLLVAAAMVLSALPAELQALHLALGTAIFGTLVLLAVLLSHPAPAALSAAGDRAGSVDPGAATPTPAAAGPRAALRTRLADYVALTKPRIISLLLLTTVIPMFVAGRPGFGLVAWTLAGGYLMAGGANALNMYLDRDVDGRMARTRTRPIPGGRMSPRHVLGFGVLLGLAATIILAVAANPLAASLALAGLLFYVFVYTRWLKRTTPLNIVIGGAAGAFPPLVGWTAVTGSLDLPAVILFLIIFYWTPPHFWALALVKRKEYRAAGIPMAPLVWGDRETRRQMLLYTLMLVPLTLIPVFTGAFGVLYGLLALLLGGRLLWMVIRLFRATDFQGLAWRVYRYSLLYLALLFGAMLADRAVPMPLAPDAEAPVTGAEVRPEAESASAPPVSAPFGAARPRMASMTENSVAGRDA